MNKRRNLYLQDDTVALLRQIAADRHGGNQSAALAAALRAYAGQEPLARRAAITGAVVALGVAQEPDERYDPADDPRAEQPAALLAGMVDHDAAEAIAAALSVLWVRWVLERRGV